MYFKGDYKKQYTFEERKEQSQKILDKHINRVPVIVELDKNCPWNLDKSKYLFPGTNTLAQSLITFRNKLNIGREEALFIFINDVLPNSTYTMNQLYASHKDNDGMLYIVLSKENTFG